MAVLKYKIFYVDGHEIEVIATPRAQVMAEERFGGVNDATALRATYYIAWASLFKAGKESDDFETWLDKVADIETPEVTAVPPMPGVNPSLAPSSS